MAIATSVGARKRRSTKPSRTPFRRPIRFQSSSPRRVGAPVVPDLSHSKGAIRRATDREVVVQKLGMCVGTNPGEGVYPVDSATCRLETRADTLATATSASPRGIFTGPPLANGWRSNAPSMSRTGRAPAPASTASARSSPSTCRSACSSLSSAAVGATGANSVLKRCSSHDPPFHPKRNFVHQTVNQST